MEPFSSDKNFQIPYTLLSGPIKNALVWIERTFDAWLELYGYTIIDKRMFLCLN